MRKIGLLILLSCLVVKMGAQIVNVEDRRAVDIDTSGWFGNIDMGFNLVKNTSEIFNISGQSQIEYIKNRHYVLNVTNYALVKAEGTEFINDGFTHLRYNYFISKKWTYEAFGQIQYNEKINLRLRGLTGTGMRYLLLEKNKKRFYLGLAYMFEYNQEKEPLRIFRDSRMTTYLSASIPITKFITLSGTTYYQPVLFGFKVWRLSSQNNLVISITNKLKFVTSFRIVYDTRAAEGIPNTIYNFNNRLRFTF